MITNITHPSIARLLADIFGVSEQVIKPDLAAGTIDAWDSFGHLQVVLALEQEFSVHFPIEKISELTTVATIEAALREAGAVL
jgi:acyl carrier protein